jgi:F-type H+-transporting ATPase subunit b
MLNFNGTAIAVLINFAIMVWIVQRFLFKPIGKILDDRHLKIREELAQSEAQLKQAQADREEAKRILTQAHAESQTIIRSSMEQAQQLKTELEQRTQSEVEAFKVKAQAALEAEHKALLSALQQEAASVALVAAEKMLEDVLDDSVRSRLQQSALQQLGSRRETVRA